MKEAPGRAQPGPGGAPSIEGAATGAGGAHHGWRIVAAVFVILTASSGLTVYAMSVYLHGFVAEGRFPIGQVSFASGTFSVAAGVVGLGVGRLLDRHDARLVMTAGCVLMLAALASVRWVDGVLSLYAFYAVLGVGYGAAALIPCTTLVARWFGDASRPKAMAIAATGNSFGAVVLVPPAAALVGALGLDQAGLWIAVLLGAGVLVPTWMVLKSWPRDLGLAPAGDPGASGASGEGASVAGQAAATARVASSVASERPADASDPYRAAVRTRYFKAINLAFMLGMAAHVGGQTHLFNLLMQRGAGSGFASLAIAAMAASSVLARFGAVWALKRLSNRRFMAVLLALQGIALWGCGAATDPAVLFVCIVGFGATLGNFITQQSLLLAEAFGVAAYARLYGLSRVWGVPGVLFGPGLMGVLFERSGGYLPAYLAIGAVSLSGIAALALAGPSHQGATETLSR